MPDELFGYLVCVMDDGEVLRKAGREIPQGVVCLLHPCSLTVCALGPATRTVLIHTRNKPSPFLTLTDVLGFLLFVDLGLAFCRYLSLQKKDSALSISASNLEGGYYLSGSVNSSSDFIILSI